MYPVLELRLDLAAQMVEAIGGEQQRQRRVIERLVLAAQDLPDQDAGGAVGGLAGDVDARAEVPPQALRLRGRAGAVDAFEDDQLSAHWLLLTSPLAITVRRISLVPSPTVNSGASR